MTVNSSYKWDTIVAGGIPVANSPQSQDSPGAGWVVQIAKTVWRIRYNLKLLHKKKFLGCDIQPGIVFTSPARVSQVIADLLNPAEQADAIGRMFDFFNPTMGHDVGPQKGRLGTLDDYLGVFQGRGAIEEPPFARSIRNDKTFGNTFAAGFNPLKIRQLRVNPNTMNFDNAKLKIRLRRLGVGNESDSPDELVMKAIKDKKLYVAEYPEFSNLLRAEKKQSPLKNGKHLDGSEKFLNSPIALFCSTNAPWGLDPLAIRLQASPSFLFYYQTDEVQSNMRNEGPFGNDNNITAWKVAKLVVIAAHSQHHEQVAHLAYTHLVQEAIAVSTRMELPATHPIHRLVQAHIEGTLPINHLAVTKLIQPGMYVDRLVATDHPSTIEIVKAARFEYNFSANYFPKNLVSRGVEDEAAFPQYPVRTYGLKIWNALKIWMTVVVDQLYVSNAALLADTELQAWAKLISSEQGGKLKGFGSPEGGIKDKETLADTLTMIAFKGGPEHAMVNFAQASDMSYLPAAPLCVMAPLPQTQEAFNQITEQEAFMFVPKFDIAVLQAQQMTFLGSIYHTQLGRYQSVDFADSDSGNKVLRNAQQTLLATLKQIGEELEKENARRIQYGGRPYLHLLPSKIPQSINI